MTDDTIERIETLLEESDEQLAEDLPGLLDDVEGQTDALVREHPVTFGRMVERMSDMDVAAFVSANPQSADQFQALLWAGMHRLVEESPEVRDEITTNISVNFVADDCPMEGHLVVDGDSQTLDGGAGLVEDATLEITGPADTLVGLVTGRVDPIQGFMQQRYEMDGPVQKGTRLAPIMNSLSENIPS